MYLGELLEQLLGWDEDILVKIAHPYTNNGEHSTPVKAVELRECPRDREIYLEIQ